MKKLLSIMFALLLIAQILPAYAEEVTEAAFEEKGIVNEEPVQPGETPVPTNEPNPSFAPNPQPELNGPDEEGYWHCGYSSRERCTEDEIRAMFSGENIQTVYPLFSEMPSAVFAPWILGAVNVENEQKALNHVNAIRRLEGIDELTLSDAEIENAQYAAWICAHNHSIDHAPSCDPEIPEEFCTNGFGGCQTGNLYMGQASISGQIASYMSDRQSNNLANVGHRQHILDPRLSSVGFGLVGDFKSMSVRDKSNPVQESYDFISWPVSDNMPVIPEMFAYNSPWSITFRPGTIKMPSVNDSLTVVISREGETVAELVYGVSPSMPEDAANYTSTGEYIRIGQSYARGITIVFRPHLTSNSALCGEYTVEIGNLRSGTTNEHFTVKYKVNFLDLAEPDEPGAEEPITPALIGDIDGNGFVVVSDALLAMRFAMGICGLDEAQQTVCDVNGDGRGDITDAVLILRFAMGTIGGL